LKINNIADLGMLIALSGETDISMINTFDTAAEKLLNDKDRPKKATILLSSTGGKTWIGKAIAERIEFLSRFVDLRIIAMTMVASAGVRIFLSLPRERRFVSPGVEIMVHQVKRGSDPASQQSLDERRKRLEEELSSLEAGEKEERRWIKLLAKELGLTYSATQDLWIKSHRFSAKEAVERGLAASIIRF